MSGSDEPEERRTEGVRIIGAQEAAEAAQRPDVVRRRRGKGKRSADRPERPTPDSDLPKITISTTEGDLSPLDTGPDEEYPGGYGDPSVPSYGHARIVGAASRPADGEDSDHEPARMGDPDPAVEREGAVERESGDEFEPVAEYGGDEYDEPDEPGTDPVVEGEPWEPADLEDEPWQPAGLDDDEDDELEHTIAMDAADLARELDPSGPGASDVPDPYGGIQEGQMADDDTDADPGGTQAFPEPPSFEPSYDPALLRSLTSEDDGLDEVAEGGLFGADPSDPEERSGVDDDLGVVDDDDSFVLPHWTEPPTGQVPKVVIEDPDETETLATYGSQPRWRDEGERSVDTDFDDLIDDGPRLGALGGVDDDIDDEDDFFAEGPYTEAGFILDPDELDSDEVEADLDDDEFDDVVPAPRRARRPARPRSGGGHDRPEGSGGGSDRPLGVAVGVGVALVVVGLACFWLGGVATTVLATVVVTFMAFEYFTAVRSVGHNPATLLGIVAVVGLMAATYTSATTAYPVVLGLTVISSLLWFLWVAPGERAVPNLAMTLLGVLWVGFLGSFATLFLGLGRQIEELSPEVTSNPGIGVLIAAVIATVSHDVGAYFSGRHLGRTPLSAASPNKTQEGLIGGVLASLVTTFIVVGIIGIAPIGDEIPQAFLFALLCALVAPLGDLCESFVKRDLGIKDMGSILPGHGGVLDRFDALLFVLPTAYFVSILFDVWANVAA